ncbi:MAG: serpin family protein [Erysipelotrichaceae bacterium]|nr:serpin family protein [Erysipelotrichaceae bacterium]
MDELKEQFKRDFEASSNVELNFDVTQLEANTKKAKHKIHPAKMRLAITFSIIFIIIAVPAGALFISSLRTKESVKSYNRRYSLNEIRIAESNTFKKLNTVSYPDGSGPLVFKISEEEKEAYNNFSNLTYHSLVDTSKKDNMSYSVVGLYSVINEMTNATSREELKEKFNTLLGLNESSRVAFYDKVMKSNSFASDESTIQLKNSAFFNNEFNYNQEFVNSLTKLYCEAYQINFESEANKMVEWVNQAVNSNGFIDDKFLEMNDETQLYLFSTLYFKNAWAEKYLSENNIKDDFYLSSDKTVKATYMNHSYLSQSYYDYGSYISVKDYYFSRRASVTYLVPKKVEDNIFDLTKDVNIFEEKEENIVKSERHDYIMVNLSTPKFTTKSDVDFQKCLDNLGFGDIYNPNIDSFKNAFDDEKLDDYNIYIQKIKQKNEVEFNEDGSIVKSVAMASFGAGGAAAPMRNDTLDVKLNQPFIYIIRDINGTPIFVGHVDNPTI